MFTKLSPQSHRILSLAVTTGVFLFYCVSFVKCRRWYYDLPDEEQDAQSTTVIRFFSMFLLFWQLWSIFGLVFVCVGALGILQRNRSRLRIFILHQIAALALFLLSLIPLSCVSISPAAMSNICAAFTGSDITWLFGLVPDQETCEEQWGNVTLLLLAVCVLMFITAAWATSVVWTYYSGEAWRNSSTLPISVPSHSHSHVHSAGSDPHELRDRHEASNPPRSHSLDHKRRSSSHQAI